MKQYHVHDDFKGSFEPAIWENFKANEHSPECIDHNSTHYIMIDNQVVWIGNLENCKRMVDAIESGKNIPHYIDKYL